MSTGAPRLEFEWDPAKAVSHTYAAAGADSAKIRIISARPATRNERANSTRMSPDDLDQTDLVTTMATQSNQADDDMPDEIDFSSGARGKFFKPGMSLSLPVYLDADVQAYLAERASARGVDVSQLVNELLKKDIELIEAAR